MVQVLLAFEPRLAGLQTSDETCTGIARAMLTVLAAPLRVAVSVAF
jgi:hypothetical protein